MLPRLLGLVALGLCLAPSTSQVLHNQLKLPANVDPASDVDAIRAAAVHAPGDYQAQLLAAVCQRGANYPDDMRRSLQALESRFPDCPSLYAQEILLDCREKISLTHRPEYWGYGNKPPANATFTPPSAQTVAAFDASCAAGERLEPDNAFFPMMRALGFFAARQDERGLQEIHRAARCSQWNDYVFDQTLAYERFQDRREGPVTALTTFDIHAATLLPDYSLCRPLARVVAYRFDEEEHAGRFQDALELRHDLMRCGAIMRSRSSIIIGTLVGSAMEEIAAGFPGGQKPNVAGLSSDAVRKLRRRIYLAHLLSIGRPDEARWAEQEFQACDTAHKIILDPSDQGPFSSGRPRLLMAFWIVDLLLLSSALWLLVMRIPGVIPIRSPRRRVVLAALVGLLTAALAWTWLGAWTNSLWSVTQWLSDSPQEIRPWAVPLSVALSLAIPLLCVYAVLLGAVLRRQPPGERLSAWMTISAPKFAFALLTLYALAATVTGQIENRETRALQQVTVSEGACLAQMKGIPWPGI